MTTRREQTRRDAARILRNIVASLKLPATVATYLRGYADGLDPSEPSSVRDIARENSINPPTE